MRTAHPGYRVSYDRAHPLVRRMFKIMDSQRASLLDVADRAGLHYGSITRWCQFHSPKIDALEAVLNVLGYRLTVSPIDCGKPRGPDKQKRKSRKEADQMRLAEDGGE